MTKEPAASLPEVAAIAGWHAHIYYDPATTRDRAERLRAKVAAHFPETLIGRWHDALVGPHTRAMFQVLFDAKLFGSFVPFLALNREGLTILLHADTTGDGRRDHLDYGIWMGEILPLNLRKI